MGASFCRYPNLLQVFVCFYKSFVFHNMASCVLQVWIDLVLGNDRNKAPTGFSTPVPSQEWYEPPSTTNKSTLPSCNTSGFRDTISNPCHFGLQPMVSSGILRFRDHSSLSCYFLPVPPMVINPSFPGTSPVTCTHLLSYVGTGGPCFCHPGVTWVHGRFSVAFHWVTQAARPWQ